MALIDKASLLMVPSTYEAGTLYNVLPSGNRAPDKTGENSGYDQTRADFTFDRGTNAAATRVNSDGLIEKYRENEVLYSNAFTGGTWVQSNITQTTGFSDPFGGNGASKFLETTTNDQHRFYNSFETKSYSIYTQSVYIKPFGRTQMLYGAESNSLNFVYDFTTESIISTFGSMVDYGVTNVGSGWYRFSLTFVVGGNFNHSFVQGYSGGSTIYVGDVTKGFYAYGAQLEAGLVSTDYLDSGATTAKAGVLIDLPRINYDANGENGSLLLEPQRANLIPQSEYLAAHTLIGVSSSSNATTSPEGVLNAAELVESSGFGEHTGYVDVSCTTSTDYTISIFAKANTRDYFLLRFGGANNVFTNSYAWFDLSNGTKGTIQSGITADIEDYGNGWYRLIATRTSAATNTGRFFWGLADANGSTSYTGDGSSSAYAYGFQAEAGSYVSSYIPNMGTSAGVTRAADSCSVTGVSDVIGQTEGTLYAEVDWNVKPESGSPVIGILTLNNGANNLQNSILLGIERQSGGTNRVYCFVINSNVTQAEIFGSSITDGTYKIAFAYKANDFALYVNGSQIGTDTSGSVPALSEVFLGKRYDTDTFIQSEGTKQAILFNERLTNSELATLTTL